MPNPDTHLPLTPVQFHILAALVDEPRHGYAIMQEARMRSEGRVRLGAGTLYTALRRLLEEDLVREVEETSDDPGSARRRYYELTPFGTTVLRADARRLEQLVSYARSKRILGPVRR
jgi:DNA-binding PadR family transcriptional regulator